MQQSKDSKVQSKYNVFHVYRKTSFELSLYVEKKNIKYKLQS